MEYSFLALANYVIVERKGVIRIIMHKYSTARDVLKSFLHALVVSNLIDSNNFSNTNRSMHLNSRLWMDEHYDDFILKVLLCRLSQMTSYYKVSSDLLV